MRVFDHGKSHTDMGEKSVSSLRLFLTFATVVTVYMCMFYLCLLFYGNNFFNVIRRLSD